METISQLAAALATQSAKIQAAGDAGRSVSTLNRLWRKYFQIEDALKASNKGGW
jgi:hypothetical protein